MVEVGMDNTLRPHEFDNLIHRARSNVWQSVYRPIYEVYPPLRPAFSIRPVVQPSGVEFPDPMIFEQEAVEVDSAVQSIQAFRNKRLRSDISWEAMLNSQRVAAIRKWIGIITESLTSFDLGRRWSRLAPLGASLAEGLKDVFAGKSTGTLHARAGPILRYVSWCHDSGVMPFPLDENTIYQFMYAHDHSAPTFLRSFLVSLRFAHFLLGLSGADEVTTSPRVVGKARRSFLDKRKLKQKDPFTCEMVSTMEEFVCDVRHSSRERFVIGCFLLCIYMRARFSDLQNLTELRADEGHSGGLPIGYIEGKVGRSKTSFTTERKTMFLPMTSPRCGLTGKDWYSAWLMARLQSAVPRGEGIPTFPALTNQGWARVPITAGAAADWLRRILTGLRFDLSHINLGTHSAKTTTLSWMSKHGAALDIRQLLGYHSTGGSVLVYSRDALSGPLRALNGVLTDIRLGRFLPDQTRSGYFPGRDAPEREEQSDLESTSSSDSEDSLDEEDNQEDMPLTESATDAVVGEWSEHATVHSLGLDDEPDMFRNVSTRYIHLVADESGDHFRCGRPVNSHYTKLEVAPKFLSPQCKQCFRQGP